MTDQANSAKAMSDEEIVAKVIEIVSQQSMIEVKEVTLDSTPDELGIDSLGLVEIVFAIEETFDITVPYNANDQASSDFDISSVGAVVGAVKKLIAEQA
ncbi:MAG: phosphopantetheine-binding protein [Pseudomonadota bacterium]